MRLGILAWVSALIWAGVITVSAQSKTWTGGGDGATWSNPANWSGGTVPTAADDVAIAGGAGAAVVIASGDIVVRSLQCAKTLTIAGGSLKVVSGASLISGAFSISNGAALKVAGPAASLTASGMTVAADADFYALQGGALHLPKLLTVTNNTESPTWQVDGAGSLLDLSALTNLTMGYYRVLYISAYNGGKVDVSHLETIGGSVDVDARNSGTIVDFSGLVGRWRGVGSSALGLEAQTGASILMPNVTQLEHASLRVDNTGQITTAQLNLLTNVTLTADGAAPELGAVTNIDDTSVYALNGGVARLTNVVRVLHGDQSPAWKADGAGSLVDLSALATLTLGYYRVLYVQAYDGGKVDLHRLATLSGSVDVDARDAGTIVDFSGLVGRWRGVGSSALGLEAQTGASILMPNVTQLEHASLRVDNTGTITTAQLNLLTNVTLTADSAAPNLGAVTNIDDTSVYALNGGVARLTNVVRVLHGNQSPAWQADGAGSLVDLSALTSLTLGYYRVLYVQTYDGGKVDLHRISSLSGSVDVDARDAGTIVDFSGLVGRWRGVGSSALGLEAQTGATILMPNVTQLEHASLRVDNTGTITTAQLNLLTNVTLTADSAAPNLGAVTNIDDTSVYALNGGVARLTNVVRVLHGNQSPAWQADGVESLVDLSALTSLTLGYYRVLYVQAYDGGKVDLHRLSSLSGSVDVDARDAGTIVDFSGLAGRWRGAGSSALGLEAQTGASILMPNVTQLEHASLRVDNTGTISTAQLNLLTNVDLTVDASMPNLGALTNIDDTSVYALNGGVARLTNVVRVLHGNQSPAWQADGAGSLVDLSALNSLTLGYYRVLYVQAYDGGKVDLHRLSSLSGSVDVDARGSGTIVDFSGLVGRWRGGGSSALGLEAQTGASILMPNVTQLEHASLRVDNTGQITTAQLNLLTNVTLTADGAAPDLGSVTNIDDSAIYALNGGVARLTNVVRALMANQSPAWEARGAMSLVDLSALTDVTVGYYRALYVRAYSGGKVDLSQLAGLSTGSTQVLSDGSGSIVDLSGLSTFMSRGASASSLTARNGGIILFNDQDFLLANVSISIPPGNPLLPATLIASPTLTLFGQPWHSYWVEKRDTGTSLNPWVFAARVPLTNLFQAILPAPAPNLEYRVREFVANPPILDMFPLPGHQVLTVVYDTPGKTNQLVSASNLDLSATWLPGAITTMTNSFRILPPAAAPDPVRFTRAKRF